MPEGHYKSDHPLTTPPRKERTMHDIETLINHFLGVSWGPVMPAGESFFGIEATKGNNGYYLISDGGNIPYRVRIRVPSFAHLQMIPQDMPRADGRGPGGHSRQYRFCHGGRGSVTPDAERRRKTPDR